MFTNRSIIKRASSALVAGAGALVVLTACGGGTETAMSGHSMPTAHGAASTPTTATTQPDASFNDADVMFAQMMIPHHQQAVEMAELAETRAKDPEVKELAAKIKAAQDPEIKTMRGWLKEWGKPVPTGMDGMEGMEGMDHGMPGMMSSEDMKMLEEANGATFDKRFVQMMIAHHNGAIEMAKTEQSNGVNPEATELAKTIETTQQAEIEQMQKVLDRL
ncbi:DUF305 domain-containing protein [Nonomuraea indica]|uniref:DUF305 domain-containing protein n=1 Tax=Nonomuraea indica TaxID=1581193 RepID=UPI000C7E4F24|nr:DUF305 domain-containing protein [Nonomuraea indica]